MPRPVKPRKISFVPQNKYFIPAYKPKCELEVVLLKLEELEAMRLKDIEKFSQEECAARMNVSRQTFQLIIDEARKKVAEALTEGKAISIEGGNYTFNICKYRCENCGHIFSEAYEKDIHKCPECESSEVICIDKSNFCKRRCKRKGGCINY
ncbi:DUF134 domain-containing protein [Paramaledivibacter caminithermalis]|uniref:UPF0251 protein SAMN02745912_03189 n=1 Tax=Paramaledivibacter caminithermalis (strain DSM 15212 / CIP 107654 / DViRD3) TaxID=1121301 RepID=A0A1M6S5W7_PARC5|nr:DUF134 domain-containing protein [Paramaledivibacter caminithermalis]SHK40049.1 Predicted DNA-binding protein, UPF0251 family [Paramaledivibacter caminithermalis DSM 15212]